MILFDSIEIVKPAEFAAGLFPPPVVRCKPFSLTDAAYEMGRSAAIESGMESEYMDVYPPAEFSAAEALAFAEGAREGFREIEHELEIARQATATSWAEYDGWVSSLEARDALIGHS